jgi:soluble lytic murein transglycosylase
MGLVKMQWAAGALGAAILAGWGVSQAHEALRADQTAALTIAPAIVAQASLPSAAEMARLRDGIAASDAGDWMNVRYARDAARDPLVRKLLTWRVACEQRSSATFDELRQALDTLQNWPCRDTIRRRAEQSIFDSALPMRERITWLQSEGPITGDGKIALAQALAATGQRGDATALIKESWRSATITPRAETVALTEFGAALSSDDHAMRVDLALWRDDRSTADRLVSRLEPDQRLLTNARLVLQRRPKRGVQIAVDAVPAHLREHPGFMYDRVRYTRRTGRPEAALPVAARINPAAAPEAVRDLLAEERRLYVSRALRSGDSSSAYRLVSNHGLSSGAAFADVEWLAGWIALRYRNDAATADRHFARLNQNVSSPVSKSRALYWLAQSKRAVGDQTQADALLRQAAQLNFTYYGQLAAAQIDTRPLLSLQSAATIDPATRAAFESNEIVRALRLIAEVGDRRDFEAIAFYLDGVLETPAEHELLSRFARDRGYARTAVRTAKAGLFRNIVAAEAAYPLMSIPAAARAPGRPEPALIHAITRQESEFDTSAVSSAGARGLMQLMPGTAREVTRSQGMVYELGRLTADPDYNVTLGSAYLGQMIDRWNGSYILAIASYNAGPHRAAEWIEQFGDPRSPNVDPVDWVELIPFSETRNYVQRVLENVQIYRHRLADTPTPLRIREDMKRGAPPQG